MGSITWTLLCAVGLAALISSTVTRSKGKVKRESEEAEEAEETAEEAEEIAEEAEEAKKIEESQSDDVVSEVAARPKSKRQKEAGESSNTTDRKRSGASSSPHVCRFCGQQFAQSQALGGHMNRHRSEKEEEEYRKAEARVAQRQVYTSMSYPPPGLPYYNMPGVGGGGGNPSYPTYMNSSPTMGQFYGPPQSAATLNNPTAPGNRGFAAPQQNAQNPMSFLQHGGGPSAGPYYPSVDNTGPYSYGLPAQIGPANPAQQFYTPSSNPVTAGQPGYVDSTSVMHSRVDQSGHNIFHPNTQGGTTTGSNYQRYSNFYGTNTASNNQQQVQSHVAMPQGGTSTGSNLQDHYNFHDTNTASNNQQQVQSHIAEPLESYILRQCNEQINSSNAATQTVDQHGNPAAELLPGLPTVKNESHDDEEVFRMHNTLDVHPDLPDGAEDEAATDKYWKSD